MNLSAVNWPSLFGLAFMAMVFLQSGFDKLTNYKREMAWIRQKFARSFLHDYVAILFLILSISEVVSGLLSSAGFVQILLSCNSYLAIYGAWASTLTMLMLIFGLRFTKDYTGAASLIPYFIACIMTLYFLLDRA
ncbi:MAG: DoxX family protein, partial [Bacteroidota bacterium]